MAALAIYATLSIVLVAGAVAYGWLVAEICFGDDDE